MRNLTLLAALSSAFAAGCAVPTVHKAEAVYTESSLAVQDLAGRTGTQVGRTEDPVYLKSGVWLPTRAKTLEATQAPQTAADQVLRRKIEIAKDFTSIAEVAERITALSGVPVEVAPDAQPSPGGTGNVVSLAYSGTMAGFFDTVAARFNLSWKSSNGRILFFGTDTRVFTVKAIPGNSTVKTHITTSGASGTSGGTSSSNESSVDSSELSVWTAMEAGVKAMLSASGKVSVSPALGTLTVTDKPEILDRVSRFVDDHNVSLSRQVTVNVQVLSVALDDSDEYGINWNAVYQALSGNFGFKLNNTFLSNVGSTGITLQIPGTATGQNFQRWAGSEAMITALSAQGKVSVMTSASAVTLNNQPAPIQVGRKTSYLASSTTTAVSDSTTVPTTTLTPGSLTTGFSMTVLPHILKDGQVLLQYAMDISSLINMYTVSSGEASIQVPDVETRNFLQRVSIRSGDTLVLAGFEQTENTANKSGAGSPSNSVLGGGVKGKDNRNVIVVLVRPVVGEESGE